MNISLELYSDTQQSIACELIKKFWLAHNNFEQSDEDSLQDLKNWTAEGHRFYYRYSIPSNRRFCASWQPRC